MEKMVYSPIPFRKLGKFATVLSRRTNLLDKIKIKIENVSLCTGAMKTLRHSPISYQSQHRCSLLDRSGNIKIEEHVIPNINELTKSFENSILNLNLTQLIKDTQAIQVTVAVNE